MIAPARHDGGEEAVTRRRSEPHRVGAAPLRDEGRHRDGTLGIGLHVAHGDPGTLDEHAHVEVSVPRHATGANLDDPASARLSLRRGRESAPGPAAGHDGRSPARRRSRYEGHTSTETTGG